MFRAKGGRTVIAEGLKFVGSVTAEGLVEVNGQIEGELYCTCSLSRPKARIIGMSDRLRAALALRIAVRDFFKLVAGEEIPARGAAVFWLLPDQLAVGRIVGVDSHGNLTDF
jgi:hypothetical protein